MEGVKVTFSPDSDGGLFALRGRLDIEVPGADVNATQKVFDTLDSLSVDATRATEDSRELLYWRRYAEHIGDGAKVEASIAGLDDAAALEAVRAHFKKKLKRQYDSPELQKQIAGVRQAFGHSRAHQYRVDLDGTAAWEDFRRDHRLHHRLYGGVVNDLEAILKGGGQTATTTEKLRRGIIPRGMSPEADLGTGGASYFFTRIKTATDALRNEGLVWKADALRRLDAISYDSDNYGRVDSKDFIRKRRKNNVAGWKRAAKENLNETIFKDGLSLFDDLDAIVVSSTQQRDQVLAILRREVGAFWPDGRKIDELVRVL